MNDHQCKIWESTFSNSQVIDKPIITTKFNKRWRWIVLTRHDEERIGKETKQWHHSWDYLKIFIVFLAKFSIWKKMLSLCMRINWGKKHERSTVQCNSTCCNIVQINERHFPNCALKRAPVFSAQRKCASCAHPLQGVRDWGWGTVWGGGGAKWGMGVWMEEWSIEKN